MVKTSPDTNNPSRLRILEAARAEFAEKGFDGARVESIAQRAEVNKALIYYYFKSKDELLEELLHNFLEERRQARMQVPHDPSSRDLPVQVAKRDVDFLFERRDILRIAMMEDLKQTNGGTPAAGSLLRHWLDGFAESQRLYEAQDYRYRITPRTLAATYFFHLMPILAFATFGEQLAQAADCDFETLRQEFLKLVEEETRDHSHTVYQASQEDPAPEIRIPRLQCSEPVADRPPQEHLGTGPSERAALVAKHMPDGRLENFPLKEKARLAVIEHISGLFQSNTQYSEREVDAILKSVVADHTKARRYLVDYGYLRRTPDGSRYWTWDGDKP